MLIDKVTSGDKKVVVEIRENENQFSTLSVVTIDIEHGSLRIMADIDDKNVCLVNGGKVEPRPFDRIKMNSIESELENALRLFREVASDG